MKKSCWLTGRLSSSAIWTGCDGSLRDCALWRSLPSNPRCLSHRHSRLPNPAGSGNCRWAADVPGQLLLDLVSMSDKRGLRFDELIQHLLGDDQIVAFVLERGDDFMLAGNPLLAADDMPLCRG